MYRVSREGKRAPNTPPRSQRHRSATSYYHSARNRLHRLSTRDPWVRFGFNAAAVLFILLAVRQMHRSMCDAERPSPREPMSGDFYNFPLYDKAEDGMQDERSHNGILKPPWGVGLRGAGHRTEQAMVNEIENLKARLAESEELTIKKIEETKELEDENEYLARKVDDLKDQLAARRQLGLGTNLKDKSVEGQRTNIAAGPFLFGKQTASNNGAKPASRVEEGLQNDLAGSTGVPAEPDHTGFEKLNADVSKEGISNKEAAGENGASAATKMPFKKLKDVEDVDNLEFQVKEGVDWEAREANSNDRLPEGKTTSMKRDEGVLDEQKGGETVEADPVMTEKVEKDKQLLPASAGGDKSEKASGELSPNSADVKGVSIEMLPEKGTGAVAPKSEESRPVVEEVKEPEGVPLEEAGKGDGVIEKDSNRDGEEKEKSAPRGKEGDEPGGNRDAAGVADPESESKSEKAVSVVKDLGDALLPKGVVGEAASDPEETLLKEAGDEEEEHEINAADKKAEFDDFKRKVMSKNNEERNEGEGVQEKEAEKDEQRQIMEQKFIDVLEKPSSTDDGDGRTSSSEDKGGHDGDVKNSSPGNENAQEFDHRPVDNEADAGAPNRDEKRPAWMGDIPEGVMKQRDEEALNLLEEMAHSAEDVVEESR